jgi:hypothetical protein
MPKATEPGDIVILRRWRGQQPDVLALFPYLPEGRGTCVSYQHVGQHGAADYAHVVRETRPVAAGDPEAAALLDELRARGYWPVLARRRSPARLTRAGQ